MKTSRLTITFKKKISVILVSAFLKFELVTSFELMKVETAILAVKLN